MKTYVVALITILLASATASAVETNAQPTATELLANYTAALDRMRSIIIKVDAVSDITNQLSRSGQPDTWDGTKVSGRPMKNYSRFEFRSDGQRHAFRLYQWGNVGSATKVTPESQAAYWSSYWDGRQKLDRGGGHITYHKSPPSVSEVSQLLMSRGEMRGYLVPLDRRLDALVRTDSSWTLRKKTETVNGAACYAIDASTDQGKVSLWIDPAHGYHAAKVSLSMGPGNRRAGQRLPAGTSDRCTAEVSRFEQKDGVWLPMEWKILRLLDFRASREFTRTSTSFKCTEIRLDPDHDSLHSFDWKYDPELKDGIQIHEIAQVGDEGLEQARYIWQNGRPVPDPTWRRRGR